MNITNSIIETAVFAMLGGMVLIPAVLAVSLKNIFHCALWLVVSLTGVGGIFALLGSDFLFVAQLLVYSGGITVLLLFVVLLSGKPQDWVIKQVTPHWAWAFFVAGIFVGVLAVMFQQLPTPGTLPSTSPTSAALGQMLIGEWILPFEALSLVLLAALVGAVHFSKRTSTP